MHEETEFVVKRFGPLEVPKCDGWELRSENKTKITFEIWYSPDGSPRRFKFFQGNYAEVDLALNDARGALLTSLIREVADFLENGGNVDA